MRREYKSSDIINSGEAIIDIRDNRTAYGMIFYKNHQNTLKKNHHGGGGNIKSKDCIQGAAEGGVTRIIFKVPESGALHLYIPERDSKQYDLRLQTHRNIEIICGSEYYDKGYDVSNPVEKLLL